VAATDIRVRLSPEGLAEVLAAFRAVRSEADATSKVAADGFSGLNRILGVVKKQLVAVATTAAAAFTINAIIAWGRGVEDAAERAGDLSRGLGTTAQSFSAVVTQGRLSRVTVEEVASAMSKLNGRVDALRAGEPATVAFFKRLRLGVKDFSTTDAAEHLVTFARGLNRLSDDGTRTVATVAALGKHTFALDGFLRAAADKGLGGMKLQAQELGQLLDNRLSLTLSKIHRNLIVIEERMAGFALAFIRGAGPDLVAMIDDVDAAVKTLSGDFETSGTAAAHWGRGLLNIATFVAAPVVGFFQKMINSLEAFGLASEAALKGDFASIGRISREADARAVEIERRTRAAMERALHPPKAEDVVETPDGSQLERERRQRDIDAREAFQRRLKDISAHATAEKGLFEALRNAEREADERAFERGRISVTTFYAHRRAAAEEAAAAEIAALGEVRAAQDQNPDQEAAAQERNRLDKEIQARAVGAAAEIARLDEEQRKRVIDLAENRVSLEQQLGEAENARHVQELDHIRQNSETLRRELLQLGFPAVEVEAHVTSFRIDQEAKEAFQHQLADLELQRTSFQNELDTIQVRLDAHQITRRAAAEKIAQLERERLPRLRAIAQALAEIALATGDQKTIQQAHQVNVSIEELAKKTEHVGDVLRPGVQSAVSGVLSEIGGEVRGLIDLFEQLGRAIARAIGNAAIGKITEKLLSFIPGFKRGGIVRHASGGPVSGPGTGTSDSILAWLSNREFVEPADAVRAPGVLPVLEYIRRHKELPPTLDVATARAFGNASQMRVRSVARFKDGGMVGDAGSLRSGRSQAGQSATVNVTLSEDLVGKVVGSRALSDEVIKIVVRNRRALSRTRD
jgi:hypothetical protein